MLVELDRRNGSAELGIFIGEADEWGKGYGTDAVNAIVDFGFGELRLERIWLNVWTENDRARRAYEKAGFVHEGTLRHDRYEGGRFTERPRHVDPPRRVAGTAASRRDAVLTPPPEPGAPRIGSCCSSARRWRSPRSIERMGGIQMQYAPAGYIGLWSRMRDFDRPMLTHALEERRVDPGNAHARARSTPSRPRTTGRCWPASRRINREWYAQVAAARSGRRHETPSPRPSARRWPTGRCAWRS